jgi:DNA-binding NarL/FixJ family response regulator
MRKIRILIAEDHTIVRKGLVALLKEEDRFEVVSEAEDGHMAVKNAIDLKPDIAMIDIGIPSLNGLEAAAKIKREVPDVKILMLTMYENEEYIIKALQIGASGYLIKKSAPDDLINAIYAAMEGEIFLSPSISTKVISSLIRKTAKTDEPKGKVSRLTPREREILQLIAEGLSNREIAEKLFISPKTVKVHRFNLMEKLGLHNTAEIIQFAIKNGLIHLDYVKSPP